MLSQAWFARVAAVVVSSAGAANALPPNFIAEDVGSNWNQAVGITFATDGRMFVWEKGGRVWNVENGVKAGAPLIDIAEEVGDWRDYGCLGFCLDPDFDTNGYIYLLYVVDYHHLRYFGTPDYDPFADEYYRDTIARLTRFTCNPADGFRSVIPGSRHVLVGESMSTGFPILHQSHGIGTVLFGEDGTLIVGCGDAASYDEVDDGGPNGGSSNTALADGIITPKEDIGAFRAQLVDCLDGKMIRIDPQTGDGLPSNPYYDAQNPRSARSRVWARGFRNPFRLTLRPGSGNPDPSAGDPGTLYIGDVGWFIWEELNVCPGPGMNFGWPLFEGMDVQCCYPPAIVANQDAPNPLFGFGGCGQEFFNFQDLIVQETLNPPSWPNPCDAGQQVPPDMHRSMHARPVIDWGHGGPSRTRAFDGFGNAISYNLDDPNSPVPGPWFAGSSATGGVWYAGTDFPSQYQNTYFFADFVNGWIRYAGFDDDDQPLFVSDFAGDGESGLVVALATSPGDGGLYYAAYDFSGGSVVRRIRYVDNAPPVAIAEPEVAFGPAPLTVQFDGSQSFDPENLPLVHIWDFGDGSYSFDASPLHTYELLDDITAQGTFAGRIFELNPPHPLGGGNWDPEVMRDGDFPPAGSFDDWRQYDTFHNGDQGGFDWIGYTFPQTRELRQLVFQEGKHFGDGGWFDTLSVQYRTPGGQWRNVQGIAIEPGYPGFDDGSNYDIYRIRFNPVNARGIRISGDPGGFMNFISVGELRVLASASPPITDPVSLTARLYVIDPFNNFSFDDVLVSMNNSPPQVEITSPPSGFRYSMQQDTLVDLAASITDAEHGTGELSCSWQVILHHDEHIHPEPPDSNCQTQALVSPHGTCGGGDSFFYEIVLTVTDAAGLSGSDTVYLFPDCCPGDYDFNGVLNVFDFLAFQTGFTNGEPRADYTVDGLLNVFDFLAFQTAFGNGC